MTLINDEKTTNKKWADSAFFIIGGVGLGYMAFDSIWTALLFGWLVWGISGANISIESLIRKKETERAIAYFDGDLEALRLRTEMGV